MEKRYQVFISSTFRDLKDERQAALRAILEIDHIPAGMELFPASDDAAWELIQDVIDTSDYYLLIIGGKYGSVDEEGVSFTEKEYDYAVSTKKRVIALLHENPEKLPRENTETGDGWEKLEKFRAKVEGPHTCVYWNSTAELQAIIVTSLTREIKKHPAIGWIRADQVASSDALRELVTLQKRIVELEAEAVEESRHPPQGTENLEQGDDLFRVRFFYDLFGRGLEEESDSIQVATRWDGLFAEIAPRLIDEINDHSLRLAFTKLFKRHARELLYKAEGLEIADSKLDFAEEQVINTCIVQLRALGLITSGKRKRGVNDKATYWTLTPYGDFRMTQIRALRRTMESDSNVVSDSDCKRVDETPQQ